jgi:hypothetical protein
MSADLIQFDPFAPTTSAVSTSTTASNKASDANSTATPGATIAGGRAKNKVRECLFCLFVC